MTYEPATHTTDIQVDDLFEFRSLTGTVPNGTRTTMRINGISHTGQVQYDQWEQEWPRPEGDRSIATSVGSISLDMLMLLIDQGIWKHLIGRGEQ